MIRAERYWSTSEGRWLHRWRCELTGPDGHKCNRVSVGLIDRDRSEQTAAIHDEWHRQNPPPHVPADMGDLFFHLRRHLADNS